MRRVLIMSCMAIVFAACTYPVSSVVTTDERPRIAFSNSPSEATAYVDGIGMGSPCEMEKRKQALSLEPGTHKIEVRDPSGLLLFKETVFLGSGTLKTFVLATDENKLCR